MLQTDGWQSGLLGANLPAQAAQPGTGTTSAPGLARWPEKIAAKVPPTDARQRMQPTASNSPAWGSANSAQSLAGLIHDARNMVAAMDLYCDLLDEPGVLSAPFHHYADELRLVSGAGRRLLEKLAVAESLTELELAARIQNAPSPLRLHPDPRALPISKDLSQAGSLPATSGVTEHPPYKDLAGMVNPSLESPLRGSRRKLFPYGQPVANLAEELRSNQNLLSALAGPAVTVDLAISGGRRPIAMTGDDLTRVLVNLARNAAEAMPCGGSLQIALEEGAEYLSLSFTDNGPGILDDALESIFTPGYSTHAGLHPASGVAPASEAAASSAWPAQHRGLGLSIVRSIVAAAGGSVWAANRRCAPACHEPVPSGRDPGPRAEPVDTTALQGAILVIEFPLLESPIAT